MRTQPDISPRLVNSPFRAYVVAAIAQLRPPKRRVGDRQSELNVAVRKGARHPALALDRVLVEEHSAGAPLESALNVVRAVRQSVLTIWNALPVATDPVGAHVAETEAQAATDPLQARVFAAVHLASEADIDRLLTHLEVQHVRTEELMLALECEKARRARRGRPAPYRAAS